MKLLSLLLTAACVAARRVDFTVRGAIEVDTNENTVFLWKSMLYVLENIPCYYSQHASRWNPAYANASYARIRDFTTGAIVTNISSSIGFGFLSAFVDESPPGSDAGPQLWLFGSPCNRCGGKPGGGGGKAGGQGCAATRQVQWWKASDASMASWTTGLAGGTVKTFNVEVSRVTSTAAQQAAVGLAPHKYVMILEIGTLFQLNNAADGDLSKGWFPVKGATSPGLNGGPSIRYSPLDLFYYAIEGGHHVELIRTKDFVHWERSPNAPFLQPSVADAQVAPFAGFAAIAKERGFGPMSGATGFPKWYCCCFCSCRCCCQCGCCCRLR